MLQKTNPWPHLKWWDSGERQAVEERLDDLPAYNPGRGLLYRALDVLPLSSVRVAIFSQDPYPDSKYCTGIAFSIPRELEGFPPTLGQIYQEYCDDLHYSYPTTGDLTHWCNQGVLLWNVIPSCDPGNSLSHSTWPEYPFLTKEIIDVLGREDMIYVFLGAKARAYVKDVRKGRILEAGHPSPRANRTAKQPFQGSRIFTTINGMLKEPIDWRLP